MTESGHIKIKDNKIVFEYLELPEPKKENYSGKNMQYFDNYGYYKAVKGYEASRRKIKVENRWYEFWCGIRMIINKEMERIINDQPCEAEVKDGKAMITKMI